jgi:hypothetical protein
LFSIHGITLAHKTLSAVESSTFSLHTPSVWPGLGRRVDVAKDDSGAAEVLESGIKVRSDDITAISDHVVQLLNSLQVWEATVRAEAREIEEYPDRNYVDRVISVWKQIVSQNSARV